MTWLLDVNALIAALVAPHEHHRLVGEWLAKLPEEDSLATCSITELGFVRVLNRAPQYRMPIGDSQWALKKFSENGTRTVVRLKDGRGVNQLPGWVNTGAKTTDGHLLGLANEHGAKLATVDKGIPEAVCLLDEGEHRSA